MPDFLVDEDLPRSLARTLSKKGNSAVHAVDAGLRGRPDDVVLEYARSKKLILVSGDLGFGNILRFPPGSHQGIVIARFPSELSASAVTAAIARALDNIADEEMRGNLLIVEPGRIRLRRKGGPVQ